MKICVVIPVFNEAANVPELLGRLRATLTQTDFEWEVLFVDDGSADETWSLIEDAAHADPRVSGMRLSRNFGHQVALSAGLQAVDADVVVTMDGDLQHPPEVILRLLAKFREGFDVVYAVRGPSDTEGWFKVRSAELFYRLLNRLTSLNLPHGGADFRLMTRRVVDALVMMPERHRFLRGMTRWAGYEQTEIEYDRGPRFAGESSYTLRHMIRFGFDAIVSFSAVPLRWVSVLGFGVSLAGFVYLLYVVWARIFTSLTVPGWSSVLVGVLLLGGVQLVCIGVIGQYLGRMYDETKGRPLFLVADRTGTARPVTTSGCDDDAAVVAAETDP